MIAATLDLFFLPLTFFLAIILRYDIVNSALLSQYLWLIIAAPLISIPIFTRLGLYRAVVRFIDQKIVYVVVIGVTVSVALLVALTALVSHMEGYSRGVFGIYWVSAITYVVASRFLARGLLLNTDKKNAVVRIAIYGAGKAGTQLASALRAGHEYLPVAFIDDMRELNGATISGIKVYASSDLQKVIEKHNISEILLAMPSLSKGKQKNILNIAPIVKMNGNH